MDKYPLLDIRAKQLPPHRSETKSVSKDAVSELLRKQMIIKGPEKYAEKCEVRHLHSVIENLRRKHQRSKQEMSRLLGECEQMDKDNQAMQISSVAEMKTMRNRIERLELENQSLLINYEKARKVIQHLKSDNAETIKANSRLGESVQTLQRTNQHIHKHAHALNHDRAKMAEENAKLHQRIEELEDEIYETSKRDAKQQIVESRLPDKNACVH